MVLWLEDGRVVRTLKVFQKQSEHRVCFGTDEAAEHDAKQSVRVADLWAGGGTGVRASWSIGMEMVPAGGGDRAGTLHVRLLGLFCEPGHMPQARFHALAGGAEVGEPVEQEASAFFMAYKPAPAPDSNPVGGSLAGLPAAPAGEEAGHVGLGDRPALGPGAPTQTRRCVLRSDERKPQRAASELHLSCHIG